MITPKDIRAKNVAVVMVTARLPAFSRVGQRVDVTVSSSSNAKSLFGGTLVPTALKGGNGKIYAWAEGPLSVGGFAAGGRSGSSVTRNHPTVGRVPSGALVGKELGFKLSADKPIIVSLKRPDFTTAARIADAINARFGATIARAPDPASVRVVVPANRKRNLVGMVAQLENVEVTPDNVARIIINEKTGTVVMGGRRALDELRHQPRRPDRAGQRDAPGLPARPVFPQGRDRDRPPVGGRDHRRDR